MKTNEQWTTITQWTKDNNNAQWTTITINNAYNNNTTMTVNELFYLFYDISQIMNMLPWFHKSQNCEEIFETVCEHTNAHSMIS